MIFYRLCNDVYDEDDNEDENDNDKKMTVKITGGQRGKGVCKSEVQRRGGNQSYDDHYNYHHNHNHHYNFHHNHHKLHHGLPAYSHLVGICHNDEGWEYDTVTFPPCINSSSIYLDDHFEGK